MGNSHIGQTIAYSLDQTTLPAAFPLSNDFNSFIAETLSFRAETNGTILAGLTAAEEKA